MANTVKLFLLCKQFNSSNSGFANITLFINHAIDDAFIDASICEDINSNSATRNPPTRMAILNSSQATESPGRFLKP